MKLLLLLVITLLEIALHANAHPQRFKRWRDPMRTHGFTWEAVPARTIDGFTLTLFHITGKEKKGEEPLVKFEKT